MKKFLLALLLTVGITATSFAQSFIYHPNNPNFGGNTFNYSWMLSQAQAQDRNVDPTAKKGNGLSSVGNGSSTLSSFAQSLQSQLLSRISSSLLGQQFGEGTLKPGTYKLGDFQVDITNGPDGVIIRIVDNKGGETSITVPYF